MTLSVVMLVSFAAVVPYAVAYYVNSLAVHLLACCSIAAAASRFAAAAACHGFDDSKTAC